MITIPKRDHLVEMRFAARMKGLKDLESGLSTVIECIDKGDIDKAVYLAGKKCWVYGGKGLDQLLGMPELSQIHIDGRTAREIKDSDGLGLCGLNVALRLADFEIWHKDTPVLNDDGIQTTTIPFKCMSSVSDRLLCVFMVD